MFATVALFFFSTATLLSATEVHEDHFFHNVEHQIKCEEDCHVCETLAAPKLHAINKACPHCHCARQLVNATIPPCPPVKEDRFCIQGKDHDKRGCPMRHCAATHVPLGDLIKALQTCARSCDGGYELDVKTGLPVCSCICPLEQVPPRHRWQFCADKCEGRRFRMAYVASSGCEECVCEEPRPPVCPPFQCDRFCARGFSLGEDGCPLCECRGREHENDHLCPTVGCNSDCGPHKLISVERDGCMTGCSCRCNIPNNCFDDPHFGVCVERVRDRYGCPTCECARRMENEPRDYRTGAKLCPESGLWQHGRQQGCPKQCHNSRRLFDGERNCEMCDCCPDLQEKCPEVHCQQHQVDHWGCPVCACAQPTIG